jgi:hypothetical protein
MAGSNGRTGLRIVRPLTSRRRWPSITRWAALVAFGYDAARLGSRWVVGTLTKGRHIR